MRRGRILKFLLCLSLSCSSIWGLSSEPPSSIEGLSIKHQFCGQYKLNCKMLPSNADTTLSNANTTLTWVFGDGSPNETITYSPASADISNGNYSTFHSFLTTGNVTVSVLQNGTVLFSAQFHVFSLSQSIFLNSASIDVFDNQDGTVNITYQGPTFSNSDPIDHFFTVYTNSPNYIPDVVVYSVPTGSTLNQGQVLATNYDLGLSGPVTVSFGISQSTIYSRDTITCNLGGGRIRINAPVVKPCCINFAPESGKRYWLSAWVKEDFPHQVKTYSKSAIRVSFVGSIARFDFKPSGDIIDGWQRIVGDFIVPENVSEMKVGLRNEHGDSKVDVYFDDIRIHPFNSSMKSYVYDPQTLWLVAELDDNNYATFYEYDYEGQLIRIKKETSKGIRTIQESRSSNLKRE